MDMETWFAPAIEMGRLVRQYRIAQEDEKEELERRIQNSAYISRLNTMQSFNSVDFLRGIVAVSYTHLDVYKRQGTCGGPRHEYGSFPA